MTVSTLPSHVARRIQFGPTVHPENRSSVRGLVPSDKEVAARTVERSEQCQRQTTELLEGAVVGDQCELAGEGEGGEVRVHPQLRRFRPFGGELLPATFDAGRF